MFRIKKLDIFIAKQFGLLFIGTFFICQFVLMMQFLWRYIDDLIGKGLSMEVLAQFFWYMGLMLVPQALPLAILLSSLITFGNLGETSELTAIKASGISLMQTFRSLIVLTVVISIGSFYFQNNIGPKSNIKLSQLLLSMRQKSPELQIPEGVFYDGIQNCNIYVQKKDKETGRLYGIMIYRMTGSYDDQAIILADSGMLQSTAEKKHLVLRLWSGEWFENMQRESFATNAYVPYRRETFASKKIVFDYDGDFNMSDASLFSTNARGKSLHQIYRDVDSIKHDYDSIGQSFCQDIKQREFELPAVSRNDSTKAVAVAMKKDYNIDTLYARLEPGMKLSAVNNARNRVQMEQTDLFLKGDLTKSGDKIIRQHYLEAIGKFTLAYSCLIFFFIGAPLGAIIRKGGLGIPIIVSVLVFIVYYILDNTGTQMAKRGIWTVWYGKLMAPVILTPLAAFVTYKANNDSVVFNLDAYRNVLMKALGLRIKRHVSGKEVVINDPNYADDSERLRQISGEVEHYAREHKLRTAPNWVRTFFKYQPDHEIERINDEMEAVIEDLSNTRNKYILNELNNYPILAVKAHTRPFEHRWLNIASAIVIPVGLFFYIRMWSFRLRLLHDLRVIKQTDDNIVGLIQNLKRKA